MKDGQTSFLSILNRKRRGRPPRSAVQRFWKRVREFGAAVLRLRNLGQSQRALVLRETVSLGEKRFVAVIEFEDARFLIGGSAQQVQLLTELPPKARRSRENVLPSPAALVGTR